MHVMMNKIDFIQCLLRLIYIELSQSHDTEIPTNVIHRRCIRHISVPDDVTFCRNRPKTRRFSCLVHPEKSRVKERRGKTFFR